MANYNFSEITGRLSLAERLIVNTSSSAGFITEPVFVDLANGQAIIGSANVLIHDNTANSGNLKEYIIADATFTLTANITTYIVVNYNSGTPIYQGITDVNIINESNVIPAFTCYNEDNLIVHKINWDRLGSGLSNKLNMRFVKTNRFGYEAGLALGEDGTNRYVTISAGTIWLGGARHIINTFNSNADRWLFWYHDGGAWLKTATTSAGTYNNSQYQSPAGLVALGVGKWGVNWILRDVDEGAHGGYILGNDSYSSVAEAVDAPFPSNAPVGFIAHGMIVGRIITKQGTNVAALITNAFTAQINNTPVNIHNNLSGIQGGGLGVYYHSDQAIDTASDVKFNKVQVTNNLNLDATSKIYITTWDGTESNSWDDYISDLAAAGTGAGAPAWALFRDGIYSYAFSATAMKELFINIHVRHDWAVGTPFYPHIHWSPGNSTDTGVVRWGIEYTVAKGHGQEAFPATTIVYVEQAADGTAYQHQIAEVSLANVIPPTEIDSIIMCRVFRDAAHANDTFTGACFGFTFDLHYLKNTWGTKNKAPNFYT